MVDMFLKTVVNNQAVSEFTNLFSKMYLKKHQIYRTTSGLSQIHFSERTYLIYNRFLSSL